MSSPIFETPRLIVRPLRAEDFPPFFEMQGNPNVHRYTGSLADDEAAAKENLEHCISCYSKTENDWWIWAVERKSDREFVGTCAIIPCDIEVDDEGVEIGYRFLEKYWGNGYASEICNPLINHALGEMSFPSVIAQVDVLNEASVKILERSRLEFVKEYYNEKDKSTDRVYRLKAS